MLRTIVVTLTAALAALNATSAHGATLVSNADTTNDVTVQIGAETRENRSRPIDIHTILTEWQGGQWGTLTTVTTHRNIGLWNIDAVTVSYDVTSTPGPEYVLSVSYEEVTKTLRAADGTTVPCEGIRVRVGAHTETVTVTVPASCLSGAHFAVATVQTTNNLPETPYRAAGFVTDEATGFRVDPNNGSDPNKCPGPADGPAVAECPIAE